MLWHCSEYEQMRQERMSSRRSWQPQVQDFADWLREEVQRRIDFEEEVDLDLALMSTLPSVLGEEYNSMWAYGNHN